MAYGIGGMLGASLIKEDIDLHQKMAHPQKQDTAGTRTLLYYTKHT